MKRIAILASAFALFTAGALCGWGSRNRTVFVQESAQEALTTQLSPTATNSEAGPGTLAPEESTKRLQQIAAQSNGNKRARAVAAIANDLDETQIRAALVELEKTHLRERDDITALLMARWGRLNPRAAIDFAKSIKVPRDREVALRAAMKGWAEKDIAAAKEWALTLDRPLKDPALRGVIETMADSDPKAAFGMMQDIDQNWYDSLAERVFDQWTERDPREAADHVAQLAKGGLRERAMVVVASRWASRDLTGALEWSEKMWDEKSSRSDTHGTTMPAKKDALTSVLQTWLDLDADAAIRWVQDLPDETKRGDLMKLLLGAAGDRDPQQVAEIITGKLPPGPMQDRAVEDLAFRWSFSDEAGALAWIEQQTDVQMQQMFLSKLVFQMSAQNGKAAVELAEKIGGPKKEGTISQALQGWTSDDPTAAAAWVDKQSANWRYYDSVAYRWGRTDPTSATTWVNGLPAGPAKDRFLQEAAVAVKRKFIQPAIGAQWIAGISDASVRTTAYTDLARAWLQKDTEAARTWLENAPLDQQTKIEILKAHAK
jgi:hypothetical protein